MSERTFPCPVCGKSFITVEELENHQQREHPEVIERLFRCPVCGLEFPTRDMLVSHLPLHDLDLVRTKQIKP